MPSWAAAPQRNLTAGLCFEWSESFGIRWGASGRAKLVHGPLLVAYEGKPDAWLGRCCPLAPRCRNWGRQTRSSRGRPWCIYRREVNSDSIRCGVQHDYSLPRKMIAVRRHLRIWDLDAGTLRWGDADSPHLCQSDTHIFELLPEVLQGPQWLALASDHQRMVIGHEADRAASGTEHVYIRARWVRATGRARAAPGDGGQSAV